MWISQCEFHTSRNCDHFNAASLLTFFQQGRATVWLALHGPSGWSRWVLLQTSYWSEKFRQLWNSTKNTTRCDTVVWKLQLILCKRAEEDREENMLWAKQFIVSWHKLSLLELRTLSRLQTWHCVRWTSSFVMLGAEGGVREYVETPKKTFFSTMPEDRGAESTQTY